MSTMISVSTLTNVLLKMHAGMVELFVRIFLEVMNAFAQMVLTYGRIDVLILMNAMLDSMIVISMLIASIRVVLMSVIASPVLRKMENIVMISTNAKAIKEIRVGSLTME